MAPFFHVLIKPKGEAGRFLFGDLNRAELNRRFLKPYDLAKKIIEGNAVVDLGELDAVQIIRTEKPKDDALDQVMRESMEARNQLNADPSATTGSSRFHGPAEPGTNAGVLQLAAKGARRPAGSTEVTLCGVLLVERVDIGTRRAERRLRVEKGKVGRPHRRGGCY